MIKILNTKSKNFERQLEYCLNLRRKYSEPTVRIVKKIVQDIRKNKDKSLIKYEKKFNGLKKLNKNQLFFTKTEIKNSINNLDPTFMHLLYSSKPVSSEFIFIFS